MAHKRCQLSLLTSNQRRCFVVYFAPDRRADVGRQRLQNRGPDFSDHFCEGNVLEMLLVHARS